MGGTASAFINQDQNVPKPYKIILIQDYSYSWSVAGSSLVVNIVKKEVIIKSCAVLSQVL